MSSHHSSWMSDNVEIKLQQLTLILVGCWGEVGPKLARNSTTSCFDHGNFDLFMDLNKTSIKLLFDISAGQRGRQRDRETGPSLESNCYCEQRNKMRQGGGERQRKKREQGEGRDGVADTNLHWPPATLRDKLHWWTIFPTFPFIHYSSLQDNNKWMAAVGNLCSTKCVNMAPTIQWPIPLSMAMHWAKYAP